MGAVKKAGDWVGDRISGVGDSISGVGDVFGGDAPEAEETEQQKSAADVAIQQYDMARELDFIDQAYEDRVERLGTQRYSDYAAAKGIRAGSKAMNEASDAMGLQMQQSGIDPSSGAASSMRTNLQKIGGDSTGRAVGGARFNTDTAYLGGKANRVAMALGDATQSVIGMNDIADQSVQKANAEAFNQFNSKAAMNSAVGTAAGLGLSYYQNNNGNGD